jgi:hypothetical protein
VHTQEKAVLGFAVLFNYALLNPNLHCCGTAGDDGSDGVEVVPLLHLARLVRSDVPVSSIDSLEQRDNLFRIPPSDKGAFSHLPR